VLDYDILNTEVRAQLFSHAFGYAQSTVDFGDISTQAGLDYGDEDIHSIANDTNPARLTSIQA
jgi:hypothetical protein